MSIPSLGRQVLGRAIRQLQEAFYQYVAEILVPDYRSVPNPDELREFESILKEGIQVCKWWLNHFWQLLQGDEWSEAGIQLEHFDEWVTGLEDYLSAEFMFGLEHNQYCTRSNCCKYLCTFHRLNAELSLFVYNNFLDYERDPITNDLLQVWYLDQSFY